MNSAAAGTAHIERAIFTAIRSPMGSGYRIVASTGGISASEQREIVRCAPAHGSLCENSPTADGLASFTMESGRQCLLLARHAGPEQTARGGYRILTHVLVLEPEVFARFGWDPLVVERAAMTALGKDLLAAPPDRLEALTLRYPRGLLLRRERRPESAVPEHTDRLVQVVAAMLSTRPTVVLDAPLPRDLLRCALLLTPAIRRRGVALSCGLRPSSARPFQFVLANAAPAEVSRIRADQQVSVWSWDQPVAADDSRDPWLGFLRQRILSQEFDQAARLAGAVTSDELADGLAGTLQLVGDIERAAHADAALLDELAGTHLQSDASAGVLPYLLDDLRLAMISRRAKLAPPEEAAETEAATSAAQPSDADK